MLTTAPTTLIPLDSFTVRPAIVAWSPLDTRVTDNGWWTDGKVAIAMDCIRHAGLRKRLTGFYEPRAKFMTPVPLTLAIDNYARNAIPCGLVGVDMRGMTLAELSKPDGSRPFLIARDPVKGRWQAFNAWYVRAVATVRPDEWRLGAFGGGALLAYRDGKPVALVMGITLPDDERKRIDAILA